MPITAGPLRRYIDRIESGSKTPEDLLLDCLERIRHRDPVIHAWVEVAPQPALDDGPLRGIPFGAKDIFETAGLATEYGSPLYKGRKGAADAAIVRRLRTDGAVLVGKTQTTAFAFFDPAPTDNPRLPGHTPGGSSSGSAAAVADSMVPFALGSQTLGSVIRPASYCGVVGFKPSYGVLSMEGVMPFAPSLDTVGLFTQTAGDMRLLWERLGFGLPGSHARRLGVPPLASVVEAPMADAFRDCVARLRSAGFEIEDVELPNGFAGLDHAARTVAAYEGARSHRERWAQFGERMGVKLAELIRRGNDTSDRQYQDAKGALTEGEQELLGVFAETPVLLTPAAPGPPPAGLGNTGDPILNSPWTGIGVPAISVPMTIGGLPMGMQMVTAGSDALLLETAAAVEARL